MTSLPAPREGTLADGKAALFRSLFDAEFSYVWNTLRRLGVPAADVLDQTQEVFLVVHGLLPDYDASRPARPWLFAIAYRVACRYRSLARHRHEVQVDEHYEQIDPTPLADQNMEIEDARALMLEAIQEIDLPRRAVFILAELEEQPTPKPAGKPKDAKAKEKNIAAAK